MQTVRSPISTLRRELVRELERRNQRRTFIGNLCMLLDVMHGYTLNLRPAYLPASLGFDDHFGTVFAIQYKGKDALLLTMWDNAPAVVTFTELAHGASNGDAVAGKFASLAADLKTIVRKLGYELYIPE